MKNFLKILTACAMLAAVACNRDGVIEEELRMKPEIVLQENVCRVKTGREITFAPDYRYVEGASYVWSIDGRTVGREPAYTFVAEEAGRIFLRIEVTTAVGRAVEDIRIEVSEPAVPSVILPDAESGFEVAADEGIAFSPFVDDAGLSVTLLWEMKRPEADDFEMVADTAEYIFRESERGAYTLRFTAANEDGSDSVTFTVAVVGPADMEFRWSFERTVFNIAAGRSIRIAPQQICNAFDAVYVWMADGVEIQRGESPVLLFEGSSEGRRLLEVTMKNSYREVTQSLEVNVCAAEGSYKRPKTESSSARWSRVFDYTPAPGQFINESWSATTAEEACARAEERLKMGQFVSLGGFGGYIVAGFDHSIENTGGYDFAVGGNSFDTSSEPGIVWVMQDENGNGLPDDTWYELAGSESGKPGTLSDYAVTYYRPKRDGGEIPWCDNLGRRGTVGRVVSHLQDYWPAWISADSYTLRGTRLEERNYDASGNGSNWVQPPYDWGYADNFSDLDCVAGDSSVAGSANFNRFKISNAVDFDGRPIKLSYIDFVKVQTGVNARSGILGELSTEVCDMFDLSMPLE